jgi:hypothetical protein
VNHDDFRRIALALSDVVESAHMGHPDFRVHNRIFATIHHDPKHGMVKLTLEQQQNFVRDFPDIFAPESGAWGRAGSTRVTFSSASEEIVGEVMTLAWQNVKTDHAARGAKKRMPKSFSLPPRSQKTQRRKKF